jgi:hypothetical protein
VTSQAFKGEGTVSGVSATWIVTEPVEQAITVLEQLQPKTQRFLFAVLPSSRHFLNPRETGVKSTTQTNNDLAAFVDWINTYCASSGRPDVIPFVRNHRWRLTTSQLRRTLAWFIARRPGGVIAGALQYRHQKIQMFEGYAGTSDSGFRPEVQAEEAIARGDKLVDLVVDHRHHRLTGPAAPEAESRLTEYARHTQFHGKVITDRHRMQRHLARHDPHVYPGEYVTCMHNPDRALCHRPGESNEPSLPDCQPTRCRNVALTASNREALAHHRTELHTSLQATGHLAPYLRHRLQQRYEEIDAFLTTHAHTEDQADR